MAYQARSEHELSTELFERIGDAVSVDRVGERAGDDVERRGRCHENVARWLEEHPLDGPARGWLVDRSQQQNGFVEFHAHSVVATACGALMDITLGPVHTI
ncbi:hypothetical protein SAMN02787148_12576 [Burkholderia vietnamiensis]|nr:hypothetical protein EC918_1161 [Burkholderia vietnamiensis]SCZ45042.1 hypothetical protein SAMN02787148_12576 [Burkholderia vietnamiensis]SFY38050.1 hypothetical protein SAMN02787160_1302 [Burkholderia vietnamiensis]